MSMFTCKLIDGYALDLMDGYSVHSNWVDIHSSPFFSISVVFSNGNPDGCITLEQSNDQSSDEVSGRGIQGSTVFVPPVLGIGVAQRAYPVTAGSLQADPLDLNTVPGSSVLVTTTGVTTYNTEIAGYRWVRVKFTGSVNANTTIDVWMHRKAQIGRSL